MKLSDHPQWHDAAQLLVDGFAEFSSLEDRIRLMDRLCDGLGGSLYPAFLQILYNVERNGDDQSKHLVTETFVHALATGRLPSGKMSAWGSTSTITDTAFGQTRSLGPIEFLCAWYAQPSGLPPLTRGAFVDVATCLLRLVSTNPQAQAMYRAKLMADVEDPLSGSLSSQSRTAMRTLAEQWHAGSDPEPVVDAFLASLEQGGSSLANLRGNPFANPLGDPFK